MKLIQSRSNNNRNRQKNSCSAVGQSVALTWCMLNPNNLEECAGELRTYHKHTTHCTKPKLQQPPLVASLISFSVNAQLWILHHFSLTSRQTFVVLTPRTEETGPQRPTDRNNSRKTTYPFGEISGSDFLWPAGYPERGKIKKETSFMWQESYLPQKNPLTTAEAKERGLLDCTIRLSEGITVHTTWPLSGFELVCPTNERLPESVFSFVQREHTTLLHYTGSRECSSRESRKKSLD